MSSDSTESFSVEVPHAEGYCNILLYHNLTLSLYPSLKDAESCLITEIRGLKSTSSVHAQHEYLAVTISRNTAKACVVFERMPSKQSIRRHTSRDQSSLSSPEVTISSSASASTRSVSSFSSLSPASTTKDQVTFHAKLPTYGDRWTWWVGFQNPIPFYIAINIASAISTEFPEYHPLEDNCYFFVQLFCEILKNHLANDILEIKQGHSKKKDGSTRSGHFLNIQILSKEKVLEAMKRVYPVFTDKLTTYRTTLQGKQYEQSQREEIQQLRALLAQRQQSNDNASRLVTTSTR